MFERYKKFAYSFLTFSLNRGLENVLKSRPWIISPSDRECRPLVRPVQGGTPTHSYTTTHARTHARTRTHTHTHTHTHARTHAHTHARAHRHVHTYTHAHAHTHTHTQQLKFTKTTSRVYLTTDEVKRTIWRCPRAATSLLRDTECQLAIGHSPGCPCSLEKKVADLH